MASKIWTKEEIFILKVYCPLESSEALSKRLGRSVSSIQNKSSKLGLKIKRKQANLKWTKEMEFYLRRNAGKVKVSTLCRNLKVSRTAIRHKASRMGVSLREKGWSEEELNLLISLKEKGASYAEISEKIGRSANACKCKWAYISA